jgi:hypothetical protein
MLHVHASGGGDVEAVSAGGLEMRSSGSTDLSLDRLDGPLSVSLGGSGDVRITDGRAEPFQVSATGSGGVRFGGVAIGVDVRLTGGGDVRVGAAEGARSVRITGGGDFSAES